MSITVILALLRKLPWKIIGPVLVVLALGLCVRHTIQANARADAYARVAQMASKFALDQELQRKRDKVIVEDSVTKLLAVAHVNESHAQGRILEAETQVVALKKRLTKPQGATLDSIATTYESALAKQMVANSALGDVIGLRTRELFDAENSIQRLQTANAALQAQASAVKVGSNWQWKVATAVAVVGGVVAFVAK